MTLRGVHGIVELVDGTLFFLMGAGLFLGLRRARTLHLGNLLAMALLWVFLASGLDRLSDGLWFLRDYQGHHVVGLITDSLVCLGAAAYVVVRLRPHTEEENELALVADELGMRALHKRISALEEEAASSKQKVRRLSLDLTTEKARLTVYTQQVRQLVGPTKELRGLAQKRLRGEEVERVVASLGVLDELDATLPP